jgi:DNA-directed RNA polymerase subunit N (RpoN/RPB10)
MIIPIKCFTCGTLIGDKYLAYLAYIQGSVEPTYFNESNKTKTKAGHAMDELGLFKPCCRRHMLTHVDI